MDKSAKKPLGKITVKNLSEMIEQIEIEQIVKEREKTSGTFDFDEYHKARMKRIKT